MTGHKIKAYNNGGQSPILPVVIDHNLNATIIASHVTFS